MKEVNYIEESHDRCADFGLSKEIRHSKKILKGDNLYKKLESKKSFIKLSQPFISKLYDFVKGSNFFTILTDENGCILNVAGDEKILSEAFSLKITPGAYMDEENIGTNAISLALTEKKPIQLSGEAHFISAYHRWTCSAAPIKNSKGQIIGVLNLTGYSDLLHPHTLGMVAAAANAIEKILEVKSSNAKLKNMKIFLDTMLDSIPSGIITSDLQGNIKTLNKYATELFGYDYLEMQKMNVSDLFGDWDKVIKSVKGKESFLDEDVYVNARRNLLQLNLSVHPILDHKQQLKDVVYVFNEVKKVRKLANKIMGRQAIYTFDKIIGTNRTFIETIEFAKKIADSRSTILLMGESGTGKEVFAQSIHNYSDRSKESFVAINCGAIPKNLIESELFGYEEGAFTGAKRSGHPGKFEIADGGTIFLDEIGEMPLDMQTRLLRVIEEGTVSRVGSTKEVVVNVRIIAATNKNLSEEVKKGNFRKDLYYRLNVLPLRLTPLRERKEDIPLLIDYFMGKKSKKLNKKKLEISSDNMKKLLSYNWPGNIRELENFVELILNTEKIPDFTSIDNTKIESTTLLQGAKEERTLEEMEKLHIIKTLKRYQGNITNSAKSLGIGRNTLYRKINKHGIDCSNFERRSTLEQR
ncbi:sigma 54-interacting transcriptional regulator [Proteinivorax hydrogeniformans]|uniref:Sigma 54-interacting transcriptional regulator n=1 Tax=Proteinivorax hydrogeniformans TaxID=1826727 RepID=A0AAU8HVJ8_9FIRM